MQCRAYLVDVYEGILSMRGRWFGIPSLMAKADRNTSIIFRQINSTEPEPEVSHPSLSCAIQCIYSITSYKPAHISRYCIYITVETMGIFLTHLSNGNPRHKSTNSWKFRTWSIQNSLASHILPTSMDQGAPEYIILNNPQHGWTIKSLITTTPQI